LEPFSSIKRAAAAAAAALLLESWPLATMACLMVKDGGNPFLYACVASCPHCRKQGRLGNRESLIGGAWEMGNFHSDGMNWPQTGASNHDI